MSRLPFVLLLVSLAMPTLGAQTPAPPVQGGRGGRGAQAPIGPGMRGGGPAAALANKDNVRIELAIAEAVGGTTTNKTVILITSTDTLGSVRSQMSSNSEGNGNITLDVDAEPRLAPDGRIWLSLAFDYTPLRATDASVTGGARSTDLTEKLTVVLTDGKPLLVSQSADPRGDRKVTVEVTATVMK